MALLKPAGVVTCQGTVLWQAVIRRFGRWHKAELSLRGVRHYILKFRIITRFKLFGLEQAFEEEVGVDGDLVVAMLSDGARHAAGGNDVGFAV